MSTRTPETQTAYEEFQATYAGDCAFCDMSDREPEQIIDSNSTMRVVKNYFPYATFDLFTVGEHLMIVPKRHIGMLKDFTDEEQKDYYALQRRYEANHYSVYLRAPSNPTRTIHHLHCHLIRPVGY